MAKKEHIVTYTADELAALARSEGTGSNRAKAEALTSAEIEASVASDPDEEGMVRDWAGASIEMPEPKAVLNMRIDRDVLDFFKRTGRGYQTRINAVLRAFVEAQQHRPR